MKLAVALLVTVVLAGCAPVDFSDAVRVDATPTQAAADPPPVEPTTEPAAEPITVSGDGEGNTAPFDLAGDYTVTWTTAADCYYSATLNGDGRERLFSSDGAASGETFVYDMRGEFYVDVITGPVPRCSWSITLAER